MTTEYLPTEVLARSEALGIKARTLVEGLRVGDQKSPYHGFAVEFAQHRVYAPGDDLRLIDWKILARSDRYAVKQHEQDTNYVGRIVLDATRSMAYGEGESNKQEYAKVVAATLACMILREGNSVGLDIPQDAGGRIRDESGNELTGDVPPSSRPGHLQSILKALAAAQPCGLGGISARLHELADQPRGARRGLAFVISDCLDDAEGILSGLRHLRFAGHEVSLLQVLHSDELDFPFKRATRFVGLEQQDQSVTGSRQTRAAYLRAVRAFLHKLQAECELHRCGYFLFDTSCSLAVALPNYLIQRRRVRRI